MQSMPNPVRINSRGLTAVELLLTLFLIASTMTIATPSFQEILTSGEVDVAMNRLTASLSTAKTIAVTSGETVTLCGSASTIACGDSWNDGILLYIDRNEDRQLDPSDTLIQWISMADFTGDITWRAFGSQHYLLFEANGVVRSQNGRFTLCPRTSNSDHAATIVLNRTARTRMERGVAAATQCENNSST